jgi:ankyrin repeat protein
VARSESPLSLEDAVRAHDVPAVEAALARGANPNEVLKEDVGQDLSETPLLVLAAEKGDANVVRALLLAGADIGAQSKWVTWSYGTGDVVTDQDAGDALSRAASLDHVDVVELLLQRGAKQRTEALVVAAGKGALASARMLLDHGADPGTETNRPLCAAVRRADLAMVKLLWEYGARVDVAQPGEYDPTPLALARMQKHVDVIAFLVSKT